MVPCSSLFLFPDAHAEALTLHDLDLLIIVLHVFFELSDESCVAGESMVLSPSMVFVITS